MERKEREKGKKQWGKDKWKKKTKETKRGMADKKMTWHMGTG